LEWLPWSTVQVPILGDLSTHPVHTGSLFEIFLTFGLLAELELEREGVKQNDPHFFSFFSQLVTQALDWLDSRESWVMTHLRELWLTWVMTHDSFTRALTHVSHDSWLILMSRDSDESWLMTHESYESNQFEWISQHKIHGAQISHTFHDPMTQFSKKSVAVVC
jgi:hypothetical protein